MATINPYAGDVIEFPAGTPASIMSAYYNALLRQRATPRQDFYDRAISPIFQDVVNPFLEGYIKENFANRRKSYDTDESIRQQIAQDESAAWRTNTTAEFGDNLKAARDTREQTDLTSALREYLASSNQMTPGTQTDELVGGGPTPYGPYDSPADVGITPSMQMQLMNMLVNTPGEPGGAVNVPEEVPVQTQGELAPTGGSRVITTTPPTQRKPLDAMQEFAGKNPTYAGILAKFLGPERSFSLIDPTAQASREAKVAKDEAVAAQNNQRAAEGAAKIDAMVRELESRANKNNAQAGVQNANAVGKRTSNEFMQQTIDDFLAGAIDENELNRRLALLRGNKVSESPDQIRGRAESTANIAANSRVQAAKSRAGGGPNDKPTPSTIKVTIQKLEARKALAENGVGEWSTADEAELQAWYKAQRSGAPVNILERLGIGQQSPSPAGGGRAPGRPKPKYLE